MPDLTVIDLFSGIGGLSLGFEQAGFVCIAGVEHNAHHKLAFSSIHDDANVEFSDVTETTGAALLRAVGLRRGEVDVVVGGPPCQPFSLAGKRRGTSDHRGKLIDEFVRLVDEIRPRAFLMENVTGLVSIHGGTYLRQVTRKMEALGYHIFGPQTLNAAHFGVPQFRRRVFIVGLRSTATFVWPAPTHDGNDERSGQLSLPQGLKPWVTVRDAIRDLPCNGRMRDSATVEDDDPIEYNCLAATEYQKMMRGRAAKVTGNQISVHEPHIVQMISLSSLAEGEEEPRTRYRRLFWDRPAFTLRAGSGSFTALRPIHPSRPRVITVREAARLQSFPDHVNFSPIKKWAYQQIGNSVPPLLGRALAESLREALTFNCARA